jgi:hypothetical protein
MRGQRNPSLVRAGSVLALILVLGPVLGACTKTGQFDPTEVFNSDVFDSKKKLSGQREAVFPDGVPGTTTGVPADLVKGYQPPPDPTDVDASQTPPGAPAAGAAPGGAPGTAAPAATVEAKPKPKPKPKPKLASAPGSAPGGPMHLTIGSKSAAPAPNQGAASQSDWPSPAQGSSQTNWPAPSATAPTQQTAQPSQSAWPNPPAATQ